MTKVQQALPSLADQIESRWKRSHSDIRATILREHYGLSDRSDVNECIDIFIVPPPNKWGIRRVTVRTKGSYGYHTKIWWLKKEKTHISVGASEPSRPSIPAASMPKLERKKH